MADFTEVATPDQHADDWDGDGLPPGARAVMPMFVGLLLALALPYGAVAIWGEPAVDDDDSLLAKVANVRPWVPGDDLPFSRSFGMTPESTLSETGDAALALAGTVGDDDDEAVAPDHEAFTIAKDPVEPTPDGGEEPGAPAVADANGTIADDNATAPPTKPVAPPTPADPFARITIPPSAFEGVTAQVEDPHGAMSHFYEALGRTALGEKGAVTRISQWGDSAIAADSMTGAARALLQQQFGDAGHGFSMVTQPTPWYLRKHIDFSTSGWRSQEFIRKQADDGRYGYGGVAGVAYMGARASWKTVEDNPVGTKASRFEVHYYKDRRLGDLSVKVDGEEQLLIQTASEDGPEDAVAVVEVPDGPHAFELRNSGGGMTKVYGVVIERDVPGVVLDGIGVVGARAARQLNIDDAHWARVLQQRNPDLYVLMYGGNAIPDKSTKARYKEDFLKVIARYRAALPKASCLVMSPLDHGERHRGKIRTVPRMYTIMEAQREAALESGCAWYSIFEAMGGEGAIGVWYDKGLANSDLAHPTAKGAKVLGKLFYLSILNGFHDWLEARKTAHAATP